MAISTVNLVEFNAENINKPRFKPLVLCLSGSLGDVTKRVFGDFYRN